MSPSQEHALADTGESLRRLGSSPSGLSSTEATRRLTASGPNEVAHGLGRRVLAIAAAQVSNPLVLVLIAAALLSQLLGEGVEAVVILAIVGLNAALGFFQEHRAERAARELQKLVSHTARVLRDGERREVAARELVPGDVVDLEIGDLVPADLRLLAVDDLATDESTLTGESLPVAKTVAPLGATANLPHQLTNLAFMGTTVASGYGTGLVIATGGRTLFGRTAQSLLEPQPETDFQKNIRRFSRFLLRVILALTAFVFAVNWLLGKGLLDSFLFALALAVGITPEALPIIVTITLSNGARRMAREQVIVKRLMSVEDLGNVDTLCCDKTGTLTEGTLELRAAVDAEGGEASAVAVGALLCSAPGNAVDRALAASPLAARLAPELSACRVLDRNELDFKRRRMSVVADLPEGRRLIAKGAPESVLAVCDADATGREALRRRVEAWEDEGYRVLAVAGKPFAGAASGALDEGGLTLLGFLLFVDPPKLSARESLATLSRLGVAIKVMSGDAAAVTRRICREVGLAVPEDRVITGDELAGVSDAALREMAGRYGVFARVTPEQKQRLVAGLSVEGHIVGFLGDGVNDTPALRAADVGISVDSAADVAKQAADIILLRKDLGVLAHGITEGRKTFGNITKYIWNTVSANFGNMSTVALSSLFLRFIPLLPSQILLNNFLSDAPLLAITTDRVDEDFLHRPRRWNIGLISRFMIWFGLLSMVFDLLLIGLLQLVLRVPTDLFRTAWFVESACSEMLVTFAIRTQSGFFRTLPSRWLLGVSMLGLAAAFVLPATPLGQRFFAFVPLTPPVLGLVAAILFAYFFAALGLKALFFRKKTTPAQRG